VTHDDTVSKLGLFTLFRSVGGERSKLLNNSCETFSGTFEVCISSRSIACLLLRYSATVCVVFRLVNTGKFAFRSGLFLLVPQMAYFAKPMYVVRKVNV